MSGYELSRQWFDFQFENSSKVTPSHGMLYLFLCEINNRMGWCQEFQITAKECMQGMSCHSYNTYKKCLDDLIDFGFIKLVRKSSNQWQTNIIALSKNDKALYKALDKALIKHSTNQSESTIQSTGDILKPKTINLKQENNETIAVSVISFFNEISNREITLLENRRKDIFARIKENFTIEDFKQVIEFKWGQWWHDEKMVSHFKPETLFCKKHFESYLEDAKSKSKKNNSAKGKEPNPNHYANEETYLYACKNAGVTPKDYYNAK